MFVLRKVTLNEGKNPHVRDEEMPTKAQVAAEIKRLKEEASKFRKPFTVNKVGATYIFCS